MTKKETIAKLNDKIDELIIEGKTKTKEFKQLMRLHKRLIS